MYVQWFVKGIAGRDDAGPSTRMTKAEAFQLILAQKGIQSNWWRVKGTIRTDEIAQILTDQNLDRHLHDYANFGPNSPFISLAAGCVERDILLRQNRIHSAVDTALYFATDAWQHPGALFYGWTVVGLNPAVEVSTVSEEVRELNTYRRWSPYQLEGEITAKVYLPANQIQRVEWWDGGSNRSRAIDKQINPNFVHPRPITNVRELF